MTPPKCNMHVDCALRGSAMTLFVGPAAAGSQPALDVLRVRGDHSLYPGTHTHTHLCSLGPHVCTGLSCPAPPREVDCLGLMFFPCITKCLQKRGSTCRPLKPPVHKSLPWAGTAAQLFEGLMRCCDPSAGNFQLQGKHDGAEGLHGLIPLFHTRASEGGGGGE